MCWKAAISRTDARILCAEAAELMATADILGDDLRALRAEARQAMSHSLRLHAEGRLAMRRRGVRTPA
jgi:hypothetical protein